MTNDNEEVGTEEHTNSEKNLSTITRTNTHIMNEPEEPKPVDSSKIQAEVLGRMSQCLRPPGEPKLQLSLKESEKTDDDPQDVG